METLYRKVIIDGKEENLPKEAGTYIVCRKNGEIFCDEYFAGRNSMTRWTDYIDWYFQPMEEKPETAEKMLEDGINDGTYARILDAINVNMGTPFLNAVIQFAEDYAAQSTNVVKEITDEEIFKEADNYAELARTFEDHGLEENISMDFARGATWMRDKLTLK